jgi:hypothetical protein
MPILCPLGGLVSKPPSLLTLPNASGVTWEKVTLTVDSGASDTVLPPRMLSWVPLEHTEKTGSEYEVANGASVYNLGERRCIMRLEEKSPNELEISFQVVQDVQKPLLAVSAIVRQGHSVVFSDSPHILLSSGAKVPLRHTHGTYELDIWVKKPGFTRQSNRG